MSEPLGRQPSAAPRQDLSLVTGQTPLFSPAGRRLVWLGVLCILSVAAGPRLFAPISFGWQRAEKALALQDELIRLQRRHVALRQDITYRRTPEGQALTTAEVLGVTYPHGRIVQLIPRPESGTSGSGPTLGERVQKWREAGRRWVHLKWRVLNLLLLGRHLPPLAMERNATTE